MKKSNYTDLKAAPPIAGINQARSISIEDLQNPLLILFKNRQETIALMKRYPIGRMNSQAYCEFLKKMLIQKYGFDTAFLPLVMIKIADAIKNK